MYGVLGLDDGQLFWQYDKFNGDTFAECIKGVKKEFERSPMIVDRAPQHKAGGGRDAHLCIRRPHVVGLSRVLLPTDSRFRGMTSMRLAFLPAVSPGLSAVE